MKIMLFIASLFSFNLLADKQADLIALIKENQSNPYALCNKGGILGFGKKTLRSSSGNICSDKVVAAFSLYLCVNAPKEKKVEGFYLPEQPLKKQSDCYQKAQKKLRAEDNFPDQFTKEELSNSLNESLRNQNEPLQKSICGLIEKNFPEDIDNILICKRLLQE
jgi:hypothetical protein